MPYDGGLKIGKMCFKGRPPMTTANIDLVGDNGIAIIRINRADRKNAFNLAMWKSLADTVDRVEGDDAVRVVIIASGVDNVFSAGADLEEFERVSKDPEWREENRKALGNAIGKIMNLSKPSIAMIDGAAYGAGCGVALAADIRLASPRAKFCIPPAKLGLVYPLTETKRLVDLVGPARAKEMIYTADVFSAKDAQAMGLVNRVVDGNLPMATMEMAQKISENSTHSLTEGKKMIRRVLDGQRIEDEETIAVFLDTYDGDDFAEGAAAFLEKRKPDFK